MKNEYVDIYDRNKNKTGIKKIRHVDTFEDEEYIIGVHFIILNELKEILITKRSETKKILPGKWEINGGAIDAGETSLEGLEREIKEELGIEIDKSKALLFKTVIDEERHTIEEIYLYKGYIDINELCFTDNEVCDAKYVSIDEFMRMYNSKDIVYNVNFDFEDYMKVMQMI